jgi:Tfp pilus assembly protein PilV
VDARARNGGALIEVCVALVLLATAGTGLVTLLGQTAHTMRSVYASERATRLASKELDRIALLDRAGMLARAGKRTARGFTVELIPVPTDLFDARVFSDSSAAVLLATTFYRPRPNSSNAAP